MASEFVGVIIGANSKNIFHVVDPKDDAELDDKRLLLGAVTKYEPLRMVKVPRANYEGAVRTPHDLQRMIDLVLRLEKQHG